MKKIINNNLFSFIIGVIVTMSIGVFASFVFNAKEILFTPNDSTWDVSNVGDAIEELYGLEGKFVLNYKYTGSKETPSSFPSSPDGYSVTNVDCINATGSFDNDLWNLELTNITGSSVECEVELTDVREGQVWNYDYSGKEASLIAPASGIYKLETWGAQGGTSGSYVGGYGGYSVGYIHFDANTNLYINVGGTGSANSTIINVGGYNGGGYSGNNAGAKSFGGGGATHIATKSGLLASLSNSLDDILIVAAGGGGGTTGSTTQGGSGGGYIGVSGSASNSIYTTSEFIPTGGTQSSGGKGYTTNKYGMFGQAVQTNPDGWGGGGGGGYYGGACGHGNTGAGGSGYIGNSKLYDKNMYCYGCSSSTTTGISTITVSSVASTATANTAKSGNGYAKITLVSID